MEHATAGMSRADVLSDRRPRIVRFRLCEMFRGGKSRGRTDIVLLRAGQRAAEGL